MAVIPAKSLESGLNFREANPRSARQTSRENQCSRRVAWQSKELKNLEWARVGWDGQKRRRRKKGWKDALLAPGELGLRQFERQTPSSKSFFLYLSLSLPLSLLSGKDPFNALNTLFKHDCKSVEVCGAAVCHRLVLQATLASCSDIILFGKKRFLVSRLRSEL